METCFHPAEMRGTMIWLYPGIFRNKIINRSLTNILQDKDFY